MVLHDDNNIERVYLKTLGSGVKVLAVMACEPHSGVSSLAMALAQRHLLAEHSVLYIEMNSVTPSMSKLCTIDGEQVLSLEPALIESKLDGSVITGLTAPTSKETIVALRNPQRLKSAITTLSADYDAIVIDCAPLCMASYQNTTHTVPSDIIASVSDATLLMVNAGRTKAATLRRSLQALALHAIVPSTVVMNHQSNPTLGQELVRECMRIEKFTPKLTAWLINKIMGSHLMHPL